MLESERRLTLGLFDRSSRVEFDDDSVDHSLIELAGDIPEANLEERRDFPKGLVTFDATRDGVFWTPEEGKALHSVFFLTSLEEDLPTLSDELVETSEEVFWPLLAEVEIRVGLCAVVLRLTESPPICNLREKEQNGYIFATRFKEYIYN